MNRFANTVVHQHRAKRALKMNNDIIGKHNENVCMDNSYRSTVHWHQMMNAEQYELFTAAKEHLHHITLFSIMNIIARRISLLILYGKHKGEYKELPSHANATHSTRIIRILRFFFANFTNSVRIPYELPRKISGDFMISNCTSKIHSSSVTLFIVWILVCLQATSDKFC